MAANLTKEKWVTKPVQLKKMIQWKIHSLSEVRHLNIWTCLCLSIETPVKNTFGLDGRPSPLNSTCPGAFKWKISLWSDGTDLFTRTTLVTPENCILTYKVNVKIGRNGQLPLSPTVALPREISSQSQPQMWKILSLEQLCSPTNGLISEDCLELFIELTTFGSVAEADMEGGNVISIIQNHPDFMEFDKTVL